MIRLIAFLSASNLDVDSLECSKSYPWISHFSLLWRESRWQTQLQMFSHKSLRLLYESYLESFWSLAMFYVGMKRIQNFVSASFF